MATELAKAYVQIMPSAKGMQGSLTKELEGEAGNAGKSAGHSIAGGIKAAIAAAGIGAALGKALTEGAALEQSIGGIETLFGDAADAVKQRAAEAYRTAGMSANQYMELTTSFSASLLQSLDGDTQKAADIADMAMTDMSDNANKMGTDMESITNAYQGFAKGNYTMLDNLKLGYGGTKAEMQRLLAKAQELSGVEYNIDNLNDVYTAIHVVQGELDITGTTAKEASTTISGSFAAMKAAFSNVLGQLTLGQDVAPAMQGLVTTVTTFLMENLIPAIWNILSALPGALMTLIQAAVPQLVQGIMSFVPQLQASITGSLPAMIEMGSNMLSSLIDGILGMLDQLAQTAIVLVEQLGMSLVDNFPQILSKGGELLGQLVAGIGQRLPDLVVMAAQAVLRLTRGLYEKFPDIIKAGYDALGNLVRGIGDALPHVGAAALEIVSSIWDTIVSIDWLELGRNIIQGIIDGIKSLMETLWDTVKNLAHSAVDMVKNALGIHSPSRVMRDEVGKYIPLGLAAGITHNEGPVRKAMREMAELSTLSLNKQMAMQMQPAYAGDPAMIGGYGHQTILNQTIYTHDSLSESELTRQAEDMLARQKWRLP